MASKPLPSQEVLRQLLRYEPKTGRLFWLPRDPSMFDSDLRLTAEKKCRAWNARNAGREAFTASDGKGYRQGQVCKYHTMAHCVIWALVHGVWPGCIDHINGDGNDNRLVNLRSVSLSENSKNRCNPSSRAMGVRHHKGAWEAYICADSKVRHLGRFRCKAAALVARKKAEGDLGFHPNHGRDQSRRTRDGVAHNLAS